LPLGVPRCRHIHPGQPAGCCQQRSKPATLARQPGKLTPVVEVPKPDRLIQGEAGGEEAAVGELAQAPDQRGDGADGIRVPAETQAFGAGWTIPNGDASVGGGGGIAAAVRGKDQRQARRGRPRSDAFLDTPEVDDRICLRGRGEQTLVRRETDRRAVNIAAVEDAHFPTRLQNPKHGSGDQNRRPQAGRPR